MNIKNWLTKKSNEQYSFLKFLSQKIVDDRVEEGSAALAFYLTLATFPAVISLIAILPFLPIPGLEQIITQSIAANIPGNAGNLIVDITREILSEKKPSLLSIGFISAVWVASSGMSAIMNQLNIVFAVTDRRSFIHKRLIAINLTAIYVLIFIVFSTTMILGQDFLEFALSTLNLSIYQSSILYFINHILGYALLLFAFSFIYYFAPGGKQKFKLFSIGSVFASTMITVAALIFNYYISNFSSYNQVYGSLGGIIIYMLWLYITGYVLLIGAVLNAIR